MIEAVSWASTFMIGLFTGSLLTEAVILVPYWRRMRPEDFLQLHATLGPNLFRYFAPLTGLAVILGVVNGVIHYAQNLAWVVTGVLCVTTLAIFFAYFRMANERFAKHTISGDALTQELARWAGWHWVRTLLMMVALGLSILGHMTELSINIG